MRQRSTISGHIRNWTTTGSRKLSEGGEEPRPVEPGTRVGLASRRDLAMGGDVAQGKAVSQGLNERNQLSVLHILERPVVRPLELDADGEVVARAAAVPAGSAGVPGAHRRRDELDQRAVAAQEKVSGYFHRCDLGEIRMAAGVELIGEKTLNRIAAVLA